MSFSAYCKRSEARTVLQPPFEECVLRFAVSAVETWGETGEGGMNGEGCSHCCWWLLSLLEEREATVGFILSGCIFYLILINAEVESQSCATREARSSWARRNGVFINVGLILQIGRVSRASWVPSSSLQFQEIYRFTPNQIMASRALILEKLASRRASPRVEEVRNLWEDLDAGEMDTPSPMGQQQHSLFPNKFIDPSEVEMICTGNKEPLLDCVGFT